MHRPPAMKKWMRQKGLTFHGRQLTGQKQTPPPSIREPYRQSWLVEFSSNTPGRSLQDLVLAIRAATSQSNVPSCQVAVSSGNPRASISIQTRSEPEFEQLSADIVGWLDTNCTERVDNNVRGGGRAVYFWRNPSRASSRASASRPPMLTRQQSKCLHIVHVWCSAKAVRTAPSSSPSRRAQLASGARQNPLV